MVYRKAALGAAQALSRALAVAVLSGSVLIVSSCSKTSGKAVDSGAARPVAVRIVPVEPRQIRRNVESVGSLFPLDEVTVSSEVEGRVEQVLVDVGDHVSAGQTIVKVVPTELQLTLDQQRASLQQARARLGLSENGGDFKDVRGAPEVKKAAADLADAEQKFQRAKTLYEQGLLPKQSFDEAESRLNAARAAYDLSVQTVENLRAQLAQSKAATSLAQKKVGDSIIRAPFAGQVKERSVTQGQYLKVQTPVMVIVNVDPMPVAIEQFDAQSPDRVVFGFGEGWHEAEFNAEMGLWRWTSDRAVLRVHAAGRALTLTLRGQPPLVYLWRPAHVKVSAGGRVVAEQTLFERFFVQARIPAELLTGDESTITIETDRTYVPAERIRRTPDRRRLGLRVFQCELRPAQP